jgi:hypothetical protein
VKLIIHLLLIIFLTTITQIGGVTYLASLLVYKFIQKRHFLIFPSLFFLLYFLSTFLIVPFVAPLFGREPVKESAFVKAHSPLYKILNRNYVTPQLNEAITEIGNELNTKYPNIYISHLDANFPFFNKFPLLPHLSHNDGKKIDIAFIYKHNNILTNKKPTISGYGFFEEPQNTEFDQTKACKEAGYWQYDFPKFLTFGTVNKPLKFPEKENRNFINIIANNKKIEKVFIEPHLKTRLQITNNKVRFHGCKAVRHDDHIHIQIR